MPGHDQPCLLYSFLAFSQFKRFTAFGGCLTCHFLRSIPSLYFMSSCLLSVESSEEWALLLAVLNAVAPVRQLLMLLQFLSSANIYYGLTIRPDSSWDTLIHLRCKKKKKKKLPPKSSEFNGFASDEKIGRNIPQTVIHRLSRKQILKFQR